MREIICVNIGQAGVQISNAVWELMCLEHGIDNNGFFVSEQSTDYFISHNTIFQEVSNSRFVPRSIFIDLEPSVIDEIRTGVYKNLFGPDQLITGLEDSSCNFARGYFTIGRIYYEEFLNILRQMINNCDSLQGFVFIQSLEGGCGSGFSSLIMEELSIDFSKKPKLEFSILPSHNQSNIIVGPYNFILASKSSIETTDLCFQHDNQSINNVFERKLKVNSPTFNNTNRLLAQIFSSITVSLRLLNSLNNNLDQMTTNLIPYPRLHYLIDIYSPIFNTESGTHCMLSTSEITREAFDFQNKLLDCDFMEEKFLSCCLQYRGCVFPRDVNQAIFEIKQKESVVFVDWCPTGFKIGINKHPRISPKSSYLFESNKSLLMISNNTCFHQKLNDLILKFNILFRKKCFIHWFVSEGMEEAEFVDSEEEVIILREDYKSLAEKIDKDDKKVHFNGQSSLAEYGMNNGELYEFYEESSSKKDVVDHGKVNISVESDNLHKLNSKSEQKKSQNVVKKSELRNRSNMDEIEFERERSEKIKEFMKGNDLSTPRQSEIK